MSDSMTRDDVLSALGEISQHFENCAEWTYGGSHERFHRWMNAADWAAAYLNDPAPTVATDTNVLGKWIRLTGMAPPEHHGHKICSVCRSLAPYDPLHLGREMLCPYCPGCGSKMEVDA